MPRRSLRLLTVLATAIVFTGFEQHEACEFAVHEATFRSNIAVPLIGLHLVSLLPVQSKNPVNLASGKILVASKNLGDPHFAQTVVLLLHYDADGAVGLILNRRTDVPLSQGLEGVDGAKSRKDPIFIGGPVGTPGVCALLQSSKKIEDAEHVFDGIYLISAKNAFEKALKSRPDPNIFHVYLGYAGWTKDQLEMEVKLGAWFIFPADESTVFNSDPDRVWQEMIKKTELRMAEADPVHAHHWGVFGPAIDLTYPR